MEGQAGQHRGSRGEGGRSSGFRPGRDLWRSLLGVTEGEEGGEGASGENQDSGRKKLAEFSG